MRPSRPLSARSVKPGSPSASKIPGAPAAALFAFFCLSAAAQVPDDTAASPPPDHPYTLHVYTDLLQIPTLVLDRHRVPSATLTIPDFRLQLDGGPFFHPSAVHIEANEPLTLALVLDASGAEDDLLKELPKLPGHGFPRTLLPHDHIAVYAVDCAILKSNIDTAAEVATSQEGISHILAAAALHQPNAPRKTCSTTKHLLDAIGTAAAHLAQEPGRRAMLVISDGKDGGSTTSLDALREFATGKSIAIFSLGEPPAANAAVSAGSWHGPKGLTVPVVEAPDKNVLDSLLNITGGTSLEAYRKQLPVELDHFVALLRSRYILQFPRPAGQTGGHHDLQVRVPVPGATVYAAGITVPVRDAALLNDPNTVPSDTSKMPVLGTSKSAH